MTYEMIVEVGTQQRVVKFTRDFENTVMVDHLTVTKILNSWTEQVGLDKSHWLIDAKGAVRTHYLENGEWTVNDAQFDGDWQIPLSWLEMLIPGKIFWGNIIGQPNPDVIVKATDAVEHVASKYRVEDGEQWFTIGDMKAAAKEAVYLALAAS